MHPSFGWQKVLQGQRLWIVMCLWNVIAHDLQNWWLSLMRFVVTVMIYAVRLSVQLVSVVFLLACITTSVIT